jgi:hypothetical protein
VTDYLVLQDSHSYFFGKGQNLKAADIISDEDFDISVLKNAGVSLILYDPTSMSAAVNAYRAVSNGRDLETMVPVLASLGIISNSQHIDMGEPVGFPDQTSSTMVSTANNRTFTISPVGDSFYVYTNNATKIVFEQPQTCIWPDVEGVHWIYFNSNGILQSTQVEETALKNASCYLLYWNASDNLILIKADERHKINMSTDTHIYLHQSLGTRWILGLALTVTPDESGNINSSAQMAAANGIIEDEDLVTIVANNTPQILDPVAQIPVFYLSGATGVWRKKEADDYPVIHDGTGGFVSISGRIAFNEFTLGSWQLTEVSINNDYVLSHIFATNNIEEPLIAIIGQNQYTSKNDARDGADSELLSLQTVGLPVAEFTPVGTVIYQTSSGYNNIPQARVASTNDGGDYVDWRGAGTFSSTGASSNDHGALTGLSDDDHNIYPLSVGRFGGQTLNGGDASGDDLTLDSTSDATKGEIVMCPSGGNVVIGASSATASTVLDVQSISGAFLPPRMTSSQRDALTATDGMIIYNTTTNQHEGRQNGAWVAL